MEKVYVSMTFSSEYGERSLNFKRVEFNVDDVESIIQNLLSKNPKDKRLIAVKKAFDTLFISINNNDFYKKLPEKDKVYYNSSIF